MSRTGLDLIIVGGGIHGAGVARDAARRGLQVCLLERDDFGSGTSSASSKLVHGGLRYLEQFRLRLVRESLVERSTLMRIAGHLVRPLPFLAPVFDHSPRSRLWMRTGLGLYDLLATGNSLGRHRWLSREEALEMEPCLQSDRLHGAFLFHDAQMNDARLCLENILAAQALGAQVRNHTPVSGLVVEDGRVCGVRYKVDGVEQERRARVVLNAAGPWAHRISAGQSLAEPVQPRLSRGSHIVTRPLTRGHAILLSAEDGRVFFVMPFKGRSLIGTTEVPHRGDLDPVRPSPEEIDYLLRETVRQLPATELREQDVLYSFAGVRALGPGESPDTGPASREARIVDDAPGLMSILGGKYTTYRAVSERITNRIERELHRPVSTCHTADEALPGGESPQIEAYFQMAERMLITRYPGLEVELLRYLLQTYGARHTEVLKELDCDARGFEALEPGLPFTRAEVRFAVHEEMATTLEDVLRRRTWRRFLGPLDTAATEAWEEAFAAAKAPGGIR